MEKMIFYSDNYQPVKNWKDANLIHVIYYTKKSHPEVIAIGDNDNRPDGLPEVIEKWFKTDKDFDFEKDDFDEDDFDSEEDIDFDDK